MLVGLGGGGSGGAGGAVVVMVLGGGGCRLCVRVRACAYARADAYTCVDTHVLCVQCTRTLRACVCARVRKGEEK